MCLRLLNTAYLQYVKVLEGGRLQLINGTENPDSLEPVSHCFHSHPMGKIVKGEVHRKNTKFSHYLTSMMMESHGEVL